MYRVDGMRRFLESTQKTEINSQKKTASFWMKNIKKNNDYR